MVFITKVNEFDLEKRNFNRNFELLVRIIYLITINIDNDQNLVVTD